MIDESENTMRTEPTSSQSDPPTKRRKRAPTEHAMKIEPSSSQSDPPTEKRNRAIRATSRKRKGKAIDLTAEDDAQVQSPPSKKKKEGASLRKVKDGEKRLRRFRQHAPSSYLEKLNRATTQRYKRGP